MRGVSNSGAKTPSARPSLFGTDSPGAGLEAAFLSIVPDAYTIGTNDNSRTVSDVGPKSAPPTLHHAAQVNTWTPTAMGGGCSAVAAAKSRTSRASRGSASGRGAGAGAGAGVLGSFTQGSQSWYPTPYDEEDDDDGEGPGDYCSNGGKGAAGGRVTRASQSHTEGVSRRTARSSGALLGAVLCARVSYPGCTPDLDDDGDEGAHASEDEEMQSASASDSDNGSDPAAEAMEVEVQVGAVRASGLSLTGRFRRLQPNRHGTGSGSGRGAPRRARNAGGAGTRAHHSDGCAVYGGGGGAGFHDFFGLEELVGAEDLAGVMCSLPTAPPASAAERLAARRSSASSSQTPLTAAAAAAAARRRSRTEHPAVVAGVGCAGGAASGSSPFLRRSHNAGLLGSNPSHPDVEEVDDEGEGAMRAAGDPAERLFTRGSYGAQQGAAAGGPSRTASVASASAAGSSGSAASQRVWICAPPLPPAAATVAFILPGAGDAVQATTAAELAAAAAGCDKDRDLLRVQSRRPGFVDRSEGGCLAAAVASSVCSAAAAASGFSHQGSGADTAGAAAAYPLEARDDGGGGVSAASSGGATAASQRRHSALNAAARVEPRRGGFTRARRHNLVAPYLGPGGHAPPAYIPHMPPGAAAVGGVVGGGSGAASIGNSFTAWSAPATAVNSPGAGGRLFADASAWAGVVGAGRRSSAGAAFAVASGGDNNDEDDSCALYGDDGRWEAHRRLAPLSGSGAAAGMPRCAAGLNLSRGPSSRSRDRARDSRNSGPGDEGDDEAEAEAAAELGGAAVLAPRRPRRCSGGPDDAADGPVFNASASTAATVSAYRGAGPDSRELDSGGKCTIRRAPFVLGSGALDDAEAAAATAAERERERHDVGGDGDGAMTPLVDVMIAEAGVADALVGVDRYHRMQRLVGPHTRPPPPHARQPLVSHAALAAASGLVPATPAADAFASPAANWSSGASGGAAEADASLPEPLSSAALAAVAALEGAAVVLPCGTGAAAADEAPSAVVGGRAHFRLRRSNASSVLASRPPSPPPEEVLLPAGEVQPAVAAGAIAAFGDGVVCAADFVLTERRPAPVPASRRKTWDDEEEDMGPSATRYLPALPPSPSPPPLLLAELPDASDRGSAGSCTMDAAAAEAVAAAAAAAVGAAGGDPGATGATGAGLLASIHSADTAASMEEVAPAFELLRARQPNRHPHHSLAGLTHDGTSAASSAASSMNGRGGLVDAGVNANAEGGTARLAALRRLAVGPSRPAWGLVHVSRGL